MRSSLHALISALLLAIQFATAASTLPLSTPSQPSTSAAGGSFTPIFSADGNHVVFVSQAHNLVTNDRPAVFLNVFVRDLASAQTKLVSVATNGLEGANSDANYVCISSNGQFVAFVSRASNLVPGDTNDSEDIFVRDIVSGTTRLVTVDITGHAPSNVSLNGLSLSSNPLISADGRWVFFESGATNLLSVGASGMNVYARDLWSNVTVLVSADVNGSPAAGKCELVSITPDARFALFSTTNRNMIPGSSSQTLYLRDVIGGTTVWAATNYASALAPCLNADGLAIAFIQPAAGGYPLIGTVVRADRGTGSFETIGTVTNLERAIIISANGQTIAFDQPVAGGSQVARWTAGHGIDLLYGTSLLDMSADGTSVAVLSNMQIFLVTSSATQLVTRISSGLPSNGDHDYSQASLDAAGTSLAFDSEATDLFAGDLNRASDVFLFKAAGLSVDLLSKAAQSRASITSFALAATAPRGISADGRFVAFQRLDDPSTPRDTNHWADLFVADRQAGTVRPLTIDTNIPAATGALSAGGNTNFFEMPVMSSDGSVMAAVCTNFSARFRRIVTGSASGLLSFLPDALGLPAESDKPNISSDGRLLIFQSTSGMIPSPAFHDYNGLSPDIFARYQRLGAAAPSNYLVSGATALDTGSAFSRDPVLSRDARWVVFSTLASDIIPGVSNALSFIQIVAADLGTDSSTPAYLVNPPKRLVSFDSNHNPLSVNATNVAISGNSRFVIFGTTSGEIYRHDLLSSNAVNDLVCTNCRNPSVSSDGNVIAYERVRPGTNVADIYTVDLRDRRESLVNIGIDGSTSAGTSVSPLLSADSRFVVFQSKSTNLVARDANGFTDIFVRDRLLGKTMLVSASSTGESANAPSTHPVLGNDGRTVVFQSFASDLAPQDYNTLRDVFVLTLSGSDGDADGMDDDWEVAYFGNLARSGQGDFDGDGVSDRAEFLAGTDPTNGSSVFRVLTLSSIGASNKRLMWSGNSARQYRVEFKDDLNSPDWQTLNQALSWNGDTAAVTDPSSTTNRFYRVVRLP